MRKAPDKIPVATIVKDAAQRIFIHDIKDHEARNLDCRIQSFTDGMWEMMRSANGSFNVEDIRHYFGSPKPGLFLLDGDLTRFLATWLVKMESHGVISRIEAPANALVQYRLN